MGQRGTWGVFLYLSLFCISAAAAEGNLDTGFGGTGIVLTTGLNLESVDHFALQDDGKIVVVGTSRYQESPAVDSDIVIARYNEDGSLDTSFGINGILSRDATGNGWIDSANSVVIQSDGKIIVGGGTRATTETGVGSFLLLRYNPDGSPDINFGTGGMVVFDVDALGNDSISSLAVQSDGKIVAAGDVLSSSDRRFAVVRFNSNGTRDTSFPTINTDLGDTGSYNYTPSLLLEPDGKIIVTGMHYGFTVPFAIAVLRYNSDGTLDDTFGTGGISFIAISDVSASDNGLKSALQPDGRILLATGKGDIFAEEDTSDFTVIRLTSSGSLDPTFGTGGIASIDLGNNSPDYAVNLTVQEDGKIVAAGFNININGIDSAIVRFDSNGTVDTSFGNQGIIIIDTGGDNGWDRGIGILVQPDGKILVLADPSPMDSLEKIIAVVRLEGPSSNLSISQTVDPSSGEVEAGENLTFSVAISNSGPNQATAVTLLGSYSSELSLVSMTPSQGSCDLSGSRCSLGTLSVSGTASVIIVVRAENPGNAFHSVTVTADGSFEVDSDDNSTSTQIFVQETSGGGNSGDTPEPSVNLSIAQSMNPVSGQIQVGQPIIFTADIHNSGTSTATGVSVSQQISPALSLVSLSTSQGTCDMHHVVCALGTMSSGSDARVILIARAEQPGITSHTVTVSATGSVDTDESDNSASDDLIIDEASDSGDNGGDDNKAGTEDDPATQGFIEGGGCSLQTDNATYKKTWSIGLIWSLFVGTMWMRSRLQRRL